MFSPPNERVLNFFWQIGIYNPFAISIIYGTIASKTNANRSKSYNTCNLLDRKSVV